MGSYLPDVVAGCIQSASRSGRTLSWTIKEINNRGTLVQLVWKAPTAETDASGKLVGSNKNSLPVTVSVSKKKHSPSRLRRNRERRLRFVSQKQGDTTVHSKSDIDPGISHETMVSVGDPQMKQSKNASRETAPSTTSTVTQAQLDLPPVIEVVAECKSVPAVSDTSQGHLEDPPVAPVRDVADCESGSTKIDSSATVDCKSSICKCLSDSPDLGLGSVSYPSDKPGCFVRYEGRKGEVINWQSKYKDVLIPVLHHGSVASGVDKCKLCRFHLEGYCRRGDRCTYAHSWEDRLEWICPTCSKDNKVDCDQKWEHILNYKCVGVFKVLDGRTVSDFLAALDHT